MTRSRESTGATTRRGAARRAPSPVPPPAAQRRVVLPRRPAFTLAEMATAMAVGGIVVTGLGSALMLSTRALPAAETLTGEDRRLARALDLIAEDLAAAVHLTDLSATSLTLTQHDRSGDAAPETVRYAWAGNSGDPLTRADNAGVPYDVAADIDDLAITWTTQTITEVYPSRSAESNTTDLYAYTTETGNTPYTLNKATHFSQVIEPSLPAGATEWTIDTIELYCDSGGAKNPNGNLEIRVDTASPDTGPDQELWSESDQIKQLVPADPGWISIDTNDGVGWVPAADPLAVVYAPSGSRVDDVNIYLGGAAVTTFFSLNGGDSWTTLASVTPVHRIRGRYRQTVAGMTIERDFVTSVTVAAADTAGRTARATAPMRNYPEVLDAVWEADFAGDPTLIDLDADADADWAAVNSADVSDAAITAGWWAISGELHAQPKPTLDAAVTTIDARLRAPTINGRAAGIQLAPGAGATRAGRLWTELWASGSDGILVLRTRDSGGADTELHREELTSSTVDFRLVLVPEISTVHLHLNGTHAGTYSYERVLTADADKGLHLYEALANSGIEIDHLRIRSGGRVVR